MISHYLKDLHVVPSSFAFIRQMYLGHDQKTISNDSLREEGVAYQKWDNRKIISVVTWVFQKLSRFHHKPFSF